jgi:GT2 family glycosyltransferase/tetratricopeptide (TPR) repeat protein
MTPPPVDPSANPLVSIAIPCCDQLAYTRLCLDSVLHLTRPPYELILIDNASTDETPAFLEEVRSRPGPRRVEVVRNAANVGYAAGCNQALAHARGRDVLFLNNDTVVTAGWLQGLLAWLDHAPDVGLVGPVTNFAPPPQAVPVGYADLADLPAFAADRRRAHAGKALEVPKLSGFCLLARRELLDRVGGFDERFVGGFFEDDDLCFRAADAGFRLLLAEGVFVHHFGSRTFDGLGRDVGALVAANFQRFRAKWGEGRTAAYRPVELPLAPQLRSPPTAMDTNAPSPQDPARVSLCMIVKDEEQNLPACLASVADLVHEVIVVDTGSTDRTREVAAAAGARVFEFPWVDDFAAARNESLRHATGDWVFWLDADDRLDEDNRTRLRALFAGLKGENAAYVMRCLCLPDARGVATAVEHLRLFRNDPRLRWQYRVHEQILLALRAAGAEVRFTDVVINHTGYQDPQARYRKRQRDLRLLQLDSRDRPDDPFVLFNLGWVYQELGRTAESLPLLQRSLERSHPGDSIVRKLYALLAEGHGRLNQPEAARAACRAGRVHYPDDAELLYLDAEQRCEDGDLAGAEECLRALLQPPQGTHFASVDPGLRGHRARYLLGLVCCRQGRPDEALAQWEQALAEEPTFAPARLELARAHLAEARWPEFEHALGRLGQVPALGGEVALLRAEACLARGEPSQARALLEQVVGADARALRPLVLLTHALLQENRDPAAAEAALRRVLQLDPQQSESWRNLVVLLRRQGRRTEALAACRSGLGYAPEDADLMLLQGITLRELGDVRATEACLLHLVHTPPAPHSAAGRDAGVLGMARHQLGLLYAGHKRYAEAETQWRAVVRDCPQLLPAWLALGDLLLSQGRWADLEQVATDLDRHPEGGTEAAVLRGRAHLARQEFAVARQVLREAVGRFPQALWPRVALSYAYLQEGKDPAATERALRDVLALDPQNAEAAHNLTLLLRKQGQAAAPSR